VGVIPYKKVEDGRLLAKLVKILEEKIVEVDSND